jgi:hypothetical protein
MWWFFEPCRFISHEHFAVFHDISVNAKIAASLHSYMGPVFSIIEAGSESLGGGPAFWRPDTKFYGNFFHLDIRSYLKIIRS